MKISSNPRTSPSWTQGLSDWIGSHTRSFAFFGGVPATVVSDYVPGRRNGLRHKFLWLASLLTTN